MQVVQTYPHVLLIHHACRLPGSDDELEGYSLPRLARMSTRCDLDLSSGLIRLNYGACRRWAF